MKRFFRENRVFAVLMLIVIICFLIIFALLIRYFYSGTSNDKYGTRNEGIEKVPISSELKKGIKEEFEKDETIEEVNFDLKGKVLYINIVFVKTTPLVDAQGKATKVLEKFSEEILSFYDIQFMLVAEKSDVDDGFIIMGAKNAVSSNVIWNNNTSVE